MVRLRCREREVLRVDVRVCFHAKLPRPFDVQGVVYAMSSLSSPILLLFLLFLGLMCVKKNKFFQTFKDSELIKSFNKTHKFVI